MPCPVLLNPNFPRREFRDGVGRTRIFRGRGATPASLHGEGIGLGRPAGRFRHARDLFLSLLRGLVQARGHDGDEKERRASHEQRTEDGRIIDHRVSLRLVSVGGCV